KKTLLFHTTGDECPSPGTSVFQLIFSSRLQRVGGFFSRLVPSPRGPRHPGQFSANARFASGRKTNNAARFSRAMRHVIDREHAVRLHLRARLKHSEAKEAEARTDPLLHPMQQSVLNGEYGSNLPAPRTWWWLAS